MASLSSWFDSGSSPLQRSLSRPIERGLESEKGGPPSILNGSMAGRSERRREGPSDEALMMQVRDGSRGSFSLLVGKYWSPLVGYSAGIVGGPEDAEDVVQDTFIRVWQRRGEWSSTGSVSAYLYRITRNLSLNARSERNARRGRDEQGARHLALSSRVRNPHDELEASSLRDEIQAAIDTLPERRREVFVLSRFHGLTHPEIAEAMGISSQTVSNQMTSALAEMRKRLAHHLRGG